MNPLDHKSMTALCKILGQGTQPCPPYAIDYEDFVMVTNQSWMMEWPGNLVDRDCPEFDALLDTAEHKLAKVMSDKFRETYWKDLLFKSGGKFLKAVEDEPDDDEMGDDALVFTHRGVQRSYYLWVNFEAAELFLPRPSYKLYKQPPDQDIPDFMAMLAVLDGEDKVGVFANQRPPQQPDVDEDDIPF